MSIQERLVRKAARLASRSQRRRAAKRARQDEGQDGQDEEQERQDEEQEEQDGEVIPHPTITPPPASSSCQDILPDPTLTSGCCGGA